MGRGKKRGAGRERKGTVEKERNGRKAKAGMEMGK